ncbi:hypothetical protein RQP46_004693 [Phenoliferia psychrophenolica]
MDEQGFHARRRAEREDRAARAAGKLGGLQQTSPLTDDQQYDTIHVFGSRERPPPIRDPPKEPGQAPDPLPPSQGRRRMNPPLSVMLGPILRYDTVVDNVWHGFALLVTTDSGSTYGPPPTMVLEWDATRGGGLEHLTQRMKIKPASIREDDYVQSHIVSAQQIFNYASASGGQSFWRFKIEVPLWEREEEIFYSVNARFSMGVDVDSFNGPSPLWRDVLRAHEQKPIHVLVGGGDQIYCDPLTREPEMQSWITAESEEAKIAHPMRDDMWAALDRFFFNHYCMWFRSGAFGQAIGKIPMLNMCDDHDIIDGFGSYPDDLMHSPVFSSIGSRGYFWYLLFQMFIVDAFDGTNLAPNTHVSKAVVFGGPGTYIPYPSRSFVSYLGPRVSILLLDCRAERKKDLVCSPFTYERAFGALKALPPAVEHVVVLLGVPIAYPRMNAVETILESKLNPLTILGKSGALGLAGFVNKFNKEAELLDDLNDHWTASHHKKERNWLIEEMQKLAVACRFRVTFLSGDVHAAAVCRLHSVKTLEPAVDPKYMLQVISSAIVNTPPPNAVLLMVSTFGKKRHKTLHHVDTDETMEHMFKLDTDGSKLKIDTIMGRRNYCMVDYFPQSGELQFDLRVETKQGAGTTKSYAISTPAPRW